MKRIKLEDEHSVDIGRDQGDLNRDLSEAYLLLKTEPHDAMDNVLTSEDKLPRTQVLEVLDACCTFSSICPGLLSALRDAVARVEDEAIAEAKLARKLVDIRDFCESYSGDDGVISDITSFGKLLTWLISISVELGLSNDQFVSQGIIQDEVAMIGTMLNVVTDTDMHRDIYSLRNDIADSFLNTLQEFLDRTGPFRHLLAPHNGHLCPNYDSLHRTARQMLLNLSSDSNIIPSSFFLKRVHTNSDQDILGSGAFADVFQGEYDGHLVVLKRLRMFLNPSQRQEYHKSLCRESLPWRQMKHPRIVPFLGIDKDSFHPCYCMVSPLIKNGNLLDYVKNHRRDEYGNDTIDLVSVFIDVAEGLSYLHAQAVVHGDLRAENILLDENQRACISDFGLISFLETMDSSTTIRGNPRFMAPELQDGTESERTRASDIYTFACMAIQAMTGQRPFVDIKVDVTVMFKVTQGQRPNRPDAREFPSNMPADTLWDLLRACWSSIPERRPPARDLVNRLQMAHHGIIVKPADIAGAPAKRSNDPQQWLPPYMLSSKPKLLQADGGRAHAETTNIASQNDSMHNLPLHPKTYRLYSPRGYYKPAYKLNPPEKEFQRRESGTQGTEEQLAARGELSYYKHGHEVQQSAIFAQYASPTPLVLARVVDFDEWAMGSSSSMPNVPMSGRTHNSAAEYYATEEAPSSADLSFRKQAEIRPPVQAIATAQRIKQSPGNEKDHFDYDAHEPSQGYKSRHTPPQSVHQRNLSKPNSFGPSFPLRDARASRENLVQYYMHNVVKTQYPLAGPSVSDLILRLIHSYSLVYDAVCMLSSCHQTLISGQRLSFETTNDLQILSLHVCSTIHSSRVCGKPDLGAVFAALQLISCNIFASRRTPWLELLNIACLCVLDFLHAAKSPADVIRGCDDTSRFVIMATMWFDVLAAPTGRRAPHLLEIYRILFGGVGSDSIAAEMLDGNLCDMLDMVGCDNRTVLALAEISALATTRRQLESRSFYIEEQEITQQEITQLLVAPVVPHAGAYADGNHTRRTYSHITKAVFRASAKVYLHGVLSWEWPVCLEVRLAVQEMIEWFRRMPQGGKREIVRATVFCICIGGSLTDEPGERAYLCGLLEEQVEVNRVGNYEEVMNVMKTVWQRRDTGKVISWRDQDPLNISDNGLLLI